MSTKRIYQSVFIVLMLAYVAYGWQFIQRTTIKVEGQKMHALFDDAMVSMQYAKNLAHGAGLVWNAGGERVEGYSNPLWVLLMAGIHLLPIPIIETSFYVKLMSLFFLILNLVVVKKLADQISQNPLVPLLAVFLTAFYFPLNNWSLQGMEVGFEALLLNAALLFGLLALQRKDFSPLPYVLFGLAVLLRMDAAAPALALIVTFAWLDKTRRKQHLVWGLGAVGVTLLCLTIFRVLYYAAWLPNTYYLKLGGISTILRISLGLRLFWDFVWNSNWVLFVLPLSLLALDKRKILWSFYALFLAQVAYSIFVGGDSWEHDGGANRFIAAVMPIFFVLLAHTLGNLQKLALQAAKFKVKWANPTSVIFLIGFTGLSLFSLNNLFVQNPVAKWTLRDKPVFTESVERYANMGFALRRVTAPQAVIAVITAGNIPYFSERTSIDLLGKNDPVIAKGPAHINSSLFQPGNFRPGHNKWNYAYSIGQLQPDVIAQIWEGTDDEVAPYLVNYKLYVIDGIPYYFREDSPYVLWDQIPPQD
jgi:hypothetical protein